RALRDSRSIDTFVDILRSDPAWGDGFLSTAARDPEVLGNLGLVRQRLRDEVVDPVADRRLVHAFARAGQLDLAYDLYARLSAQRSGEGWASDIPPFDWTLADEPGFRAQVIGGSDELQLTIARGKGGVFAKRIAPAHSRSISIRGQHELQPQRQADRLEITVGCMGRDAPVARGNLADGRITLDAGLPADCGFVEISLSGRAWSDGQRITGSIAPLAITFAE
ncbi:MAG: hypothetical protein KAY59_05060, partial [Acidobacteria bacterium]|nr:hypothetical protein [Acidobacteriota bacterium]